MRTDPKYKGEQTELLVLMKARDLGINVSIPWGDGLRYDQIWDVNGHLLRVQVKTAHPTDKNGTIKIPTKSTVRVHGKSVGRIYNHNEIDGIATVFNDVLYFIPIRELNNSNEKTLRFEEPNNNQKQNISWARDYEVSKQLKEFLDL